MFEAFILLAVSFLLSTTNTKNEMYKKCISENSKSAYCKDIVDDVNKIKTKGAKQWQK